MWLTAVQGVAAVQAGAGRLDVGGAGDVRGHRQDAPVVQVVGQHPHRGPVRGQEVRAGLDLGDAGLLGLEHRAVELALGVGPLAGHRHGAGDVGGEQASRPRRPCRPAAAGRRPRSPSLRHQCSVVRVLRRRRRSRCSRPRCPPAGPAARRCPPASARRGGRRRPARAGSSAATSAKPRAVASQAACSWLISQSSLTSRSSSMTCASRAGLGAGQQRVQRRRRRRAAASVGRPGAGVEVAGQLGQRPDGQAEHGGGLADRWARCRPTARRRRRLVK